MALMEEEQAHNKYVEDCTVHITNTNISEVILGPS